jgi:hypothetical protein
MIISFSIIFKRSHNSGFLISKFKFDQFLFIFSFCCHFIFVLWQFYQTVSGESLISRKARPRYFFTTKRKTIFSVTLLLQLRLNGILYVIVTLVFSFFLREKTHKQKKITAVHRTLNVLEYHCRVILKCKDIKI